MYVHAEAILDVFLLLLLIYLDSVSLNWKLT